MTSHWDFSHLNFLRTRHCCCVEDCWRCLFQNRTNAHFNVFYGQLSFAFCYVLCHIIVFWNVWISYWESKPHFFYKAVFVLDLRYSVSHLFNLTHNSLWNVILKWSQLNKLSTGLHLMYDKIKNVTVQFW